VHHSPCLALLQGVFFQTGQWRSCLTFTWQGIEYTLHSSVGTRLAGLSREYEKK